ncbi:MAG: phosphoglycerate kinase [Holosporales bacterium]|nr:phosphoglycerate kinase [Holosporales bacterium]
MAIRTFEDFQNFVFKNKNIRRCLVRCDLNLPSDVEDLSRVYAIKDTVLSILDLGLNVILISHYKRPKLEDIVNPKFSLINVVNSVKKILGVDVHFEKASIFDIEPESISGKITILENLRFYEGETKNDEELSKRLARFGDVYINEAFSVSHRAHASVCAVTQHIPSFAGKSFQKEICGISSVITDITRPFSAIIGGSKVSSKIDVLKRISNIADYLIIAGAMANTFLSAKGIDLKNSMVEKEQFKTAIDIIENTTAKIILPIDFTVSKDLDTNGKNCPIESIPEKYSCFDIGEKTTANILDIIKSSKTLLWNGALGAFEFANFNKASDIITNFIAKQTKSGSLISVIGGGETIASIGNHKSDMSFVSTAGGAFLEFVSGYKLPGVNALTTEKDLLKARPL